MFRKVGVKMNLYRVFGNNLSDIFVKADCADDALHKGRNINSNFNAVQRMDETAIKVYNLKIKEDEIIE